ncbi:transglycosylase SLT domain-containing protein [Candidatus Amarobacter glycogenicus]|uniref:transglycosylase SLT domain-containing protein n=1 Tax=Candidatus Amarobacter glycogenicus TaxID=3140699 RepID=UPI002A1634F7|nr:transglycosylase SLT domain-containing protein [Dehalococcoidia bacterium]
MAIDPTTHGTVSSAHVSLREAGQIARSRPSGGFSAAASTYQPPTALAAPRAASARSSATGAAGRVSRTATPHTPVQSNSDADPDQWDSMLNRMGQKYNVPPLFLKAVMLIESGGRPDAVGDAGHSVGLFQLHDQGYGHGMGDSRFDPEANADRAARGLAEAWQAGDRAGYSGEYAVRAAYNYSFNPGGGFAYQGDALVSQYNALRQEQGLPPVS